MAGALPRGAGASSARAPLTHIPAPGRSLLPPLLTGLGYYLGALLGVATSAASGGIALFWLPNGVLLAALLMVERRAWPWHLLAAVVAELAADFSTFTLAQSLTFAAANVVECTLAAWLLQRVAQPFALDRLRHVSLFGAYALAVACGVAALLGSLAYRASLTAPAPLLDAWLTWWLGDGLGVLLLTPLLLGWLQGARPSLPAGRSETVVLYVVTLALALGVFLQVGGLPLRLFLLVPVSIWAAVRFGVRGTATLGLLIAAVSIAATLSGRGPLAVADARDTVWLLQAYLAVQLFSMLALAALLQELRDRNDQLRLRERALEAISDGVVVVDARAPHLPVAFANPAYATAGASAADRLLSACRRGDDGADPRLAELCVALREGRPARQVLAAGAPGEEVWNELLVAPVRDAQGEITHYVAVQHDMTGVKRNEAELRATHEQLDSLNRDLEARVQARTGELQAANQRLEELAATDALTGASNRRAFLEQARKELSRARRQGAPLSLIMLDIDLFKAINDRHGHEIGDRALVALATTVRAALRESDVFARLGGEEFIVMLPGQGGDAAAQMAERLRALVAAIDLPELPEGMTISLGVTALAVDADHRIDDLLRRADEALYEAKRLGRNRVCCAGVASS